ncbi:1,3-beta-glucanosyltransferase [Mortierella alpina]|nr:1,3-beta-glucanosyltransferase [Mortierella alpina]
MRTTLLLGFAFATALSFTATAEELHRVPIKRIRRSSTHKEESTSHQHARTLAKYSNHAGSKSVPHSRLQRPEAAKSDIKRPQQQSDVDKDDMGSNFDASARRSQQIDAARFPIEYNPSETAFVGRVGIGSPSQYFNLEFDIGSADTWVTAVHANCSTDTPCPSKRRVFSPKRSWSFQPTPNLNWTLQFSDGAQVNGTLGSDLIRVGGFEVEHQVIGLAKSMKNVKDNGIDGSFGLGLRDLTFNGDATPIENLVYAHLMLSEVGVWLGVGNQGGELIFGGRDRARYIGEISYFDLPQASSYWSTSVQSIAVVTNPIVSNPDQDKQQEPRRKQTVTSINARDGQGTGTSLPNVIFDTSTNIIVLPPRVARKVHQAIHHSFFGLYTGYNIFTRSYTVPCDLVEKETNVWIELGPTSLPRSVDEVAKLINSTTIDDPANASADPQMMRKEGSSTNNRFRILGRDIVRERVAVIGGLFNTCHSGIQESKSDEDDWVLGNIWFMNNYMTLDHKNRQIGIAPAVQPET